MTTEPDLSLPVHFRLPPENIWVQVWLSGHDQRWTYAKRDGLIWRVDSRELPSDVGVDELLITHWRDAPPPPGEIDEASILDYLATEVVCGNNVLEAPPLELEGMRKRLPAK